MISRVTSGRTAVPADLEAHVARRVRAVGHVQPQPALLGTPELLVADESGQPLEECAQDLVGSLVRGRSVGRDGPGQGRGRHLGGRRLQATSMRGHHPGLHQVGQPGLDEVTGHVAERGDLDQVVHGLRSVEEHEAPQVQTGWGERHGHLGSLLS